MTVLKEEIFGPILPVLTYDSIDDAIAYVRNHPHPLTLYYFGQDEAEERLVLDQTVSGGVTVNDCITHALAKSLPFGGIGHSGMGAYGGGNRVPPLPPFPSFFLPKKNILAA